MRNMIAIFALLMLLFFLGRAYAQPPLYVVDLSRATTHEKLITLSLQGLANRSPETPSIYTLSGEQDEGWLSWIERLDPRPTERVSPQQLLEQFRHLAKGQILCEPSDSTSLNMATSLAGLRDGIVSDRDLGLPTLFDTRGKFRSVLEAYQWAAKEILPQCSQKGLVLLGSSIGFRDYVIREKLLALPMTTLGDKAAWRLLSRMAASFPAGTPILAPAPERIHPAIIKWGARVGHPLFGVEEAANLSYHSQLETPTFSQWRRYVELGAKIYVCFIFSGGDDLSYAQRRMSDLWRQAERGALPLGWALPAPMAGIAPDILQYYFAGAYRSGHDGFVLQVNSPSVSKPRTLHAPLVQAREATDIRSLVVIDESSDKALLPAVEELAVHFQPSGIFVPDHKSLPSKVIGESVIFTKGFSGSNADEILKRLSALPATKGGLIFVWVDSKSVSPADIFSVASLLPSYFEVVAPDEFIFLAKQVLSGEAFEVPSQTKVNLIAPASVGPDESFIVRAAIPGAKVKEALLIYQQESGIQLVEPMGRRGPDGEYSVHLGPLLHSGEWLLQARVSEGEGVVSWSEVVRLQVSPEDPDEDGLSAAAERFFGTDLASADTDNDGLLDGSDPHPLTLNSSPAVYFGPLAPVDDAPFLVEDSGSILEDNVRKVRADNYFVYHLFLEGLPPGARAVLAMRLSGTARAAFSADGKKFDTPFNLQETDGWTTAPVPAELLRSRTLFIRISAAEEPPAELSLRKLAILSPLDAPSIGLPALVPPYFGPGLPVGVSVDLWDPQTVTQAWCAYRS
ncbi:MAG: hypothetical protein GTN69_01685, partial [Armatimonadetes bacterium]|nr:hypothetical protein [Armatimonadota bacterium]NIO74611.1 hypothetical protein [Armatimonadota bacterium]NIO96566.1 hypothetical protein [Armatimonadota bacterium]